MVVGDDVDVHNTSEVLFRLCANTDPQRDSIFTKGPSDVLDHATSEIASGSKLGIDATKKIPGEGFKRAWPPLIKMDAAVKAKVAALFNSKLVILVSYARAYQSRDGCDWLFPGPGRPRRVTPVRINQEMDAMVHASRLMGRCV